MNSRTGPRAGVGLSVVALALLVATASSAGGAAEPFDTSVAMASAPDRSGRDYLRAWDSTITSLGTEQSLLSPGWRLPAQDAAFRLSQPLGLGLDLDAGVYAYKDGSLLDTGRREYFLGLSYRSFDGGVWYTNDAVLDGRAARVEAGWTHNAAPDLLFSVRMGHTDYGSSQKWTDATNLSIGAQKQTGRLGFGLRLIDHGFLDAPRGNRLRLFGTVTAEFD